MPTLGVAYELVEELGRGGMAVVHRARDARHGRDVAVKVMLPTVAEAIGAARFLREIETVARLQHAHNRSRLRLRGDRRPAVLLAARRAPVQVGDMHRIHTLRLVRLGDIARRATARTIVTSRAAIRWITTRPPEVWVGIVMAAALGLFLLILFTGSTGVGMGGR